MSIANSVLREAYQLDTISREAAVPRPSLMCQWVLFLPSGYHVLVQSKNERREILRIFGPVPVTPYRTTVCFLGHAPMGMHFDATICTRPFFSAPHPFIGSVMLHRILSSALLVPLVEACHLRVFSLAVSSGPIWI